MTPKTPINFTNREQFLVSYYLSCQNVSIFRNWLCDGTILLTSLACVYLFFSHQDSAFGFIAYALVVGRLIYLRNEGGRWSQDFQGVFTKYDAKIKELTEALSKKDDGPVY